MSGITLTYQMHGGFLDAAGLLTSFIRCSKAADKAKIDFLQTTVRLFSLLFVSCLADLESRAAGSEEVASWKDGELQKLKMPQALTFDLIDPLGLDDDILLRINRSERRAVIVHQSLMDVIMQNVSDGVLDAPPPLMTRTFQEIGNGMMHFHEALKFGDNPFPLPYIAVTKLAMLLQWFMTPCMMLIWTETPQAAAGFAFALVFAMWSLFNVADELQNPLNSDVNDLDGRKLTGEFNAQLITMFSDPERCITSCKSSRRPLQSLKSPVNPLQRSNTFVAISSEMSRFSRRPSNNGLSLNSAVSQLSRGCSLDEAEHQDNYGPHEADDHVAHPCHFTLPHTLGMYMLPHTLAMAPECQTQCSDFAHTTQGGSAFHLSPRSDLSRGRLSMPSVSGDPKVLEEHRSCVVPIDIESGLTGNGAMIWEHQVISGTPQHTPHRAMSCN